MKFDEGRVFFDTILKAEKELVPTICTVLDMRWGGAELEAWGGKRRVGSGKGGAGGEQETMSELGERC
jgi:hypothetical protein